MRTILIAEDNELNLELLIQLLEDDYYLLTCANGEEVLESLERNDPDIIIMDLSMPVLDGWQTMRQIRRSRHKELPIIALSAHAMVGEKEKAIEAGADQFITKPVDFDEFLHAIDSLLANI